MPKPKPLQEKVRLSVVMPEDLKEKLLAYAEAHHWSASFASCFLLEKALQIENYDNNQEINHQ